MESIIIAIIGVIGGGGLVSLFLIPAKVKNAKIDNSKRIVEMYADLADKYEQLACFRKACSDRINTKNEKSI